MLSLAVLVEPDCLLELGQERDEDARVAREPQRPRRVRSQQQLGQLAHAVRAQAAADPLPRDEPDARSLLAHLREGWLAGLEPELGNEAETANEPERGFG